MSNNYFVTPNFSMQHIYEILEMYLWSCLCWPYWSKCWCHSIFHNVMLWNCILEMDVGLILGICNKGYWEMLHYTIWIWMLSLTCSRASCFLILLSSWYLSWLWHSWDQRNCQSHGWRSSVKNESQGKVGKHGSKLGNSQWLQMTYKKVRQSQSQIRQSQWPSQW